MIDQVKIELKINSMKLSIARLNILKQLPKDAFLNSFQNLDSAKYNPSNTPVDSQSIFISMVKFRNKAVHLYDQIKDEEVYDILQYHLRDFDRFIAAIIKYVYK